MITTILTIVSVLLLAACAPLITLFVLYLIGRPDLPEFDPEDKDAPHFNSKAIFAVIGRWIMDGYDRTERKIAEQMAKEGHCYLATERRSLARKKNWFMAAGACPKCLNVYVSTAFLSIMFLHFDLNFLNLIYALPVTHYFLSVFSD